MRMFHPGGVGLRDRRYSFVLPLTASTRIYIVTSTFAHTVCEQLRVFYIRLVFN